MPIFVLLAYLGYPDKGLVALLSISAIIISAKAYWNYITKLWFIMIMGVITIGHFILTTYIHFPRLGHSIVFIALAFVIDLFFIFTIVNISSKFFDSKA